MTKADLLIVSTQEPGDRIGKRGEAIFQDAIMDDFGTNRSYFDAYFIEGKFPIHDFLVNVNDPAGLTAMFFAQVRATSHGYLQRRDGVKCLKVAATRKQLNDMANYPGPAYLFGVDVATRKVYFVSADKNWKSGLSAMPTHFELNSITIGELWQEVTKYWAGNINTHQSRFLVDE